MENQSDDTFSLLLQSTSGNAKATDIMMKQDSGPLSWLNGEPITVSGSGSSGMLNRGPQYDELLTVELVLDTPIWHRELRSKHFDSVSSLDDFTKNCESILADELTSKAYDTFTSFVRFYNDFKKSGNKSYINFVANYKPTLSNPGLSCVGLSLALLSKLRERFPDAPLELVSCEETVKDVGSYCLESPNTTKEHVLIAMKVEIDNRLGLILFDPGYHVGQAIVVMEDGLYPHTGWFVQSKTQKGTKEYSYDILDHQYISWNVRETKGSSVNQWENLIYVKSAFGKWLNITEKRSLCYSFKSLVIRDKKDAVAGMFWIMKEGYIWLFYPERGERKQAKISLDAIETDAAYQNLRKLSKFLPSVNLTFKNLVFILQSMKKIREDKQFMDQMLELDEWIEDDN